MLSGEEEKGLRLQRSFGPCTRAELFMELVVLWIWRIFRSAGPLNRSMDLHFPDDSRFPSDQPLGGQNTDTLFCSGSALQAISTGYRSANLIRQRFCKI